MIQPTRPRTAFWIRLLLLWMTSLGVVAACAEVTSAGPLPKGIKLIPNLEYASVDNTSLLLDLYLPENVETPLPVVVWIHGGGWTGGDKQGCPAIEFAAHGYAVASINYRFIQQAIFPAQIHDCKAAVRWLRAHANFYGLDRGRIGVWGASAGGHLVALLGTSGDNKELEGSEGNLDQSSRVQAVCDFCGPTDFTLFSSQAAQSNLSPHLDADAPQSLLSRLIGGPVQQNRDKAAKANPITYISKDLPPFLIMHASHDTVVPLAQSQILHDALQKAGGDVKLEVIAGGGHGFLTPAIGRRVLEFFDQKMRAAKPPAASQRQSKK